MAECMRKGDIGSINADPHAAKGRRKCLPAHPYRPTRRAQLVKSIQAAVTALDAQTGFALTRTMDQVHDQVLANDRLALLLFVSFGVVGLLLATVGVYGVMAFSVTQRSQEMALRVALGATRNRVMTLVVREGVALASAGLGLGFAGAYFVGRALQSILFGVPAIDSSAFGATGLVLLLAALLACYLPALKAASVETMRLLRSE
jgi:putative ABC transport system permease protein